MTKCAKVERKRGEEIRRKLANAGELDKSRRIMRDDGYIYIPLVKTGAAKKLKLEIVEKKMQAEGPKFHSLEEALAGILSEKERGELITAYDLVGDIAILEISEGLVKKEKKIAEALLSVHHNIKVVLKKAGAMEGEYRVRKFGFLAGERRTETTHSENGCRFRLDVAKVYFSPRLGFERKRIAGLSAGRGKENVLVMFAGVGPFAINIAKRNTKARVVAIELNPDAVKYMRGNVRLNRCEGRVEAVETDVRETVPRRYAGWADRILMPLPKSAEEFLDVAFAAARKKCTVHFYSFDREEEPFAKAIARINGEAGRAGRKAAIINKRIVRPFAPHVVQVVVDFRVD